LEASKNAIHEFFEDLIIKKDHQLDKGYYKANQKVYATPVNFHRALYLSTYVLLNKAYHLLIQIGK
jgi:hypothetical protein